ncbi:MAG: CHAD domain-containing protein [Burkholderiaceae bacterium]
MDPSLSDAEPTPSQADAAVPMVPREVELKLFVPATSVAVLRAHPLWVGRSVAPLRVSRIDNRYFDTPERELAARGMALRLRRVGRRWVQTLKVAEPGEGALSVRGEWEMPVAGPALELALLKDTPLSSLGSLRTLGRRLAPMFTTNFRREARMVALKDGALVECAFDVGVIASGRGRTRRVLSICELEIEVKQDSAVGALPDLMRFAARLTRDMPLIPLAASKAARGHRLSADEPLLAVKARLPIPDPGDGARLHMARVLEACNRALLDNVHALLEATRHQVAADVDLEFVHQARVAVRRMRSALRTFRSVLDRQRVADLDAWLTATGHALGVARDWDVFATTLHKRLDQEVATDAEGRAAVDAMRGEACLRRAEAHAALRDHCLQGPFGATTIAIERMATRLRAEAGGKHDARLAACAPAWLSSQRDRLIERSRRIAVLDTAQRHALRVEVKRLRYALDLLESLYDKRDVEAFRDALADLQDKLGKLNDVVVADTLIDAMTGDAGAALVRTRFRGWLVPHVRKQLPKVAALSVEFELVHPPWLARHETVLDGDSA